MLEQPFVFASCLSMQFFSSLLSPNTVGKAVQGNLPLTEQRLCDLWDTMPLYLPLSIYHPNSCLENLCKDVPLPTFLAYFLPKGITW